MKTSLTVTRVFFLLLSIFFMTAYTVSAFGGLTLTNILNGALFGVFFSLVLIGIETLFKRFNLRVFNTIVLGLFLGFILGSILNLILQSVFSITDVTFPKITHDILSICVLLFGTYLGLVMTLQSSEELYMSIPFVKFKPLSPKRKDMVLDFSIISDPRIIDLASSGLMDMQIIVPRFAVNELYVQAEEGDEVSKAKARRSLEVIKKLEGVPTLDLSFSDTDFPEVKDPMEKFVRLARLLDANILTADINRIQIASVEGVKIINIHTLSNALKPLMQAGEFINIKVQRYGKEAKQGVGYLDDGTMVVINGGGDFIGDTIKAQVLSVKHTSSGRMIFCNATDGNYLEESLERSSLGQQENAYHG